jgi:hypothetical protein
VLVKPELRERLEESAADHERSLDAECRYAPHVPRRRQQRRREDDMSWGTLPEGREIAAEPSEYPFMQMHPTATPRFVAYAEERFEYRDPAELDFSNRRKAFDLVRGGFYRYYGMAEIEGAVDAGVVAYTVANGVPASRSGRCSAPDRMQGARGSVDSRSRAARCHGSPGRNRSGGHPSARRVRR